MSLHGRFELIKLRLDRLVSTGYDTHPFEFPQFRIRAADGYGRLATPHFRLSFKTKRREGGALRRRIEDRKLHRPRVTPLIAGVVANRARFRTFRMCRHYLTQRIIRRTKVSRHL